MKKTVKLFLMGCLCLVALTIASCSSSNSDSPVGQYVDIINKMTDQLEKINSLQEAQNVQAVISPEDAMELFNKYSDYKLTDGDKDKIKEAQDKMLRTVMKKSIEFSNISEEMKKASEAQIDLAIDAANLKIDKAETFGDLNKLN